MPLEQLAVSPQCGFSSDVVGNLISPDDQRRKLEIVVETARQVWGSSLRRAATIMRNITHPYWIVIGSIRIVCAVHR